MGFLRQARVGLVVMGIDRRKNLVPNTFSAMPAPPTILIAQRPVLVFEQVHHLPRIRINLPGPVTTSTQRYICSIVV